MERLGIDCTAEISMASHPIEQLSATYLGKNSSELEPEELRVLNSLHTQTPLARDAADLSDDVSTYGERLSDKVAAVGGSWTFIIIFSVVLLAWMLLNTDVLSRFGMAFDPYPYIFLNLMLSTLAAVQAPVIMMSQNRQAAKDRLAAALDFEVNLRAELDIRRLHAKVDEVVASNAEVMAEIRALRQKSS
jgi:uncharacterized membrane protein